MLAFTTDFLAGWGAELHSAAVEDADMANSCPFVALQTCCQMAAVLKSCTVCRGNDSLQAYGLLEILKRILFQGSQTFIEQCLKTGSVLDLWFRVFIFMRNVSNRCSFGKRDLSLDSIFFFFLISWSHVFIIKAFSAPPKILFWQCSRIVYFINSEAIMHCKQFQASWKAGQCHPHVLYNEKSWSRNWRNFLWKWQCILNKSFHVKYSICGLRSDVYMHSAADLFIILWAICPCFNTHCSFLVFL